MTTVGKDILEVKKNKKFHSLKQLKEYEDPLKNLMNNKFNSIEKQYQGKGNY